jgi:hypothetical protein
MAYYNWTGLVAHIGIPFLAVIVILLFRAPTRASLPFRHACNEVALEFAILGIGATGGVFLNPESRLVFPGASGVYGILVVMLELVFAALIVSGGSQLPAHTLEPGSKSHGLVDMFLGFAPIVITGGVVLLPE